MGTFVTIATYCHVVLILLTIRAFSQLLNKGLDFVPFFMLSYRVYTTVWILTPRLNKQPIPGAWSSWHLETLS